MTTQLLNNVEETSELNFGLVMTDASKAQYEEAAAKLYAERFETINEAVQSVPSQYLDKVHEALSTPGDIATLSERLVELHGMSQRRAERVAVDVTRQVYQEVNLTRSRAAGARKGRWIHSHGAKKPRRKHLAAHGKEFDLDKGLPVGDNGQYVMPSEEYGCGCTFELILDYGAL